CAAVTHQVGGVLDLHDPIAGEYLLEVSSPGLDRSFFSAEQLHDYLGQTISLRLIHAIGQGAEKRRKVTGELLTIDAQQLTVNTDGQQPITIALDNIDKANLVYQF
ncbi:MAG: ribosome assembly cofactor RimP, partial [Acinetobacter sp.]